MQIKPKETPKITVAIRKRPINKKQLQKGEMDILKTQQEGNIVISEYKQKVDLTKYIEETTFNFDHAFDENSTNEQIYNRCIQPLIESAFQGAKISCFAYGQTGSGKTYTMKGDIERGVPGLYYLGAKQIFEFLNHPDYRQLGVHVSFYEIYCGKLYDLLNSRAQLKIREDKKQNINVIGLEEKVILSAQQFLDVIEYGSNFRVTSQNATNADSSRSHAILQISLKEGKKVFSKISFIDLAGNERGADHMDQNKQTKIDGAQINKSLLALKECIRALDQGKGHTPFRGSKLTMVLKDSFVGFCKTVMIGNVSPNVSASENTMNTLRYADRVKELKNSNDTPLTKEEQISKEMMLPRANKNSFKVQINPNDDAEDIQMKKNVARKNQQNKRNQKPDCNSDMDIEAPVQLQRRKTDVPQHEANIGSRNGDRRSMAPKIPDNHDENHQKKSINFMKNVKNVQIKGRKTNFQHNENNLNSQNKNIGSNFPKIKNHQFNFNQQTLQHDYDNLMIDIQGMKQEFINDHIQLIKEESILIKEQSEITQKIRRYNAIDPISYLQSIQRAINKKMEMLELMKKKASYLSGKIYESEDMNRALGQMNMNDEQLLEGLPADEFGGRLF